MYIIEFCGLPGVGKSTQCNNIKSTLRKNGIQTVDFSEYFYRKRTLYNRIRFSILTFSRFFSKDAFRLYQICKKFSPEGWNSDEKRRYGHLLYIFLYYYYAKHNKCQVALLDEGIIQGLSSIVHDKPIDQKFAKIADEVIKAYYNQNVYIIHCSLDEEENMNRLIKRNRKGDRFVSADRTKMKFLLSQKKKNIEYLLKYIKKEQIFSVDVSDFHKANAEILCFIEEVLK